MIVSEAIEKVKERKPNAYSDQIMLDWLNECEAQVQRDLMDTMPEGIFSYSIDDDMERELLLPRPYDSAYLFYIQAMIEFSQQEYSAYNNTIALYNNLISEAAKYYNRKYQKTERVKIHNYL